MTLLVVVRVVAALPSSALEDFNSYSGPILGALAGGRALRDGGLRNGKGYLVGVDALHGILVY